MKHPRSLMLLGLAMVMVVAPRTHGQNVYYVESTDGVGNLMNSAVGARKPFQQPWAERKQVRPASTQEHRKPKLRSQSLNGKMKEPSPGAKS